ncbi:MAG: tetratricopeptide repeat protein [Chloroflexi bacterium]|nr:tetratricopeptide repeat protein [Chloroflexota bacterium]
MSRADKFYRMCTTLPADEDYDDRDETYVPELVEVAKLRDSGALNDAIAYGKSIQKMYPDYDLIAYMVAHIYFQQQQPKEAMDVALAAIRDCKRKYRLYSVVGLAEYDIDNVANALVWWCRSVVAQGLVSDFQEYDPFLHLSYAAEMTRANKEARILMTMVDAIEPQSPRLNDSYLEKMQSVRTSWARAPFVKAIEHIVEQYFT